MAPKRAPSEAEQLASLAACAHAQLANAGRALHDDVGPLLAGAGLFLSTAPDDPAVKEALAALDQAMERVRALSQQLNSSPADRMGLHKALLRIAEQNPAVEIAYTATAKLPRATTSAIYDATTAAIDAATQAQAERIQVTVTGDASLRVTIKDNGRKAARARALSLPTKLAAASGLRMSLATKNATIVSIAYGLRRSAGG